MKLPRKKYKKTNRKQLKFFHSPLKRPRWKKGWLKRRSKKPLTADPEKGSGQRFFQLVNYLLLPLPLSPLLPLPGFEASG